MHRTGTSFLKIDAEGSEEAIIAGGDWQRFRPEVLVVESTEILTNRRIEAVWQETLRQASYTFAYFDGVNDFWSSRRERGAPGIVCASGQHPRQFSTLHPGDGKSEGSIWRSLGNSCRRAAGSYSRKVCLLRRRIRLRTQRGSLRVRPLLVRRRKWSYREAHRQLEISRFRIVDAQGDAAGLKAELASVRQAVPTSKRLAATFVGEAEGTGGSP
ncbi:MAG: FkbM family methyltransferase [Rhodospirillales bacterium]